MSFPAPIGGIVLSSDLAPSIVFAVLYVLLLPLAYYRIKDRRSRTILILGRVIFCVERSITFSIRAAQSQRPSLALSSPILKYMQSSLGMGFIGITIDLVNLVRCLLVNPTFGPGTWDWSPASQTKDSSFKPPKDGDEDQPRERFWARRFTDVANIVCLAAMISGAVGNGEYKRDNFDNEAKAREVFDTRFASNAIALCLIMLVALAAAWSRLTQIRASHKGINILLSVCVLGATISAYRFAVIWRKTPSSMDPTLPGALSSPGAKATFYILHALPEWLATATLLGVNARKIFGTGPFGDYRSGDATGERMLAMKGSKDGEPNTEVSSVDV